MDEILMVYYLDANELDLEEKHINEFTDEEFCKLAEEKRKVLPLSDFITKFNLGLINVSSEKDYIRIK